MNYDRLDATMTLVGDCNPSYKAYKAIEAFLQNVPFRTRKPDVIKVLSENDGHRDHYGLKIMWFDLASKSEGISGSSYSRIVKLTITPEGTIVIAIQTDDEEYRVRHPRLENIRLMLSTVGVEYMNEQPVDIGSVEPLTPPSIPSSPAPSAPSDDDIPL